jgi:hypothetical protein
LSLVVGGLVLQLVALLLQLLEDLGMLQSMLESVYVAEVTFERDELKAKIPGEARVEEAIGGAVLVGALDRLVRDQVAQVQDDVVVAIEDGFGHGTADGVVDLRQLSFRLLRVDPSAGAVWEARFQRMRLVYSSCERITQA